MASSLNDSALGLAIIALIGLWVVLWIVLAILPLLWDNILGTDDTEDFHE